MRDEFDSLAGSASIYTNADDMRSTFSSLWPLLLDLESFSKFEIERANKLVDEGNWNPGIGAAVQTDLDALMKRCNPYSSSKKSSKVNQNEVLLRLDALAAQLKELKAKKSPGKKGKAVR